MVQVVVMVMQLLVRMLAADRMDASGVLRLVQQLQLRGHAPFDGRRPLLLGHRVDGGCIGRKVCGGGCGADDMAEGNCNGDAIEMVVTNLYQTTPKPLTEPVIFYSAMIVI